MTRLLVGITGASGALYAKRFVEHCLRLQYTVELIVTTPGLQVLEYEGCTEVLQMCKVHDLQDYFAPPASGSSHYTGMVLLPCSMGTLGKLASGVSDSLLTRAAEVCLKEQRPLIAVPREMPLSRIHLQNMLRLQEAGAQILPACPHFYQHPKSLEDLIDTVLAKVFSGMNLTHDLSRPWGEN